MEGIVTKEAGALILIDILYEKGLINTPTYQKIQSKYKKKSKIGNKIVPNFALSYWKIG